MNATVSSQVGVMTPQTVRVESLEWDTADTFTMKLNPPSPFHFKPGQFNMLYAHGAGEVPISISGDPDQPQQLIHTIRCVGNVTRALGNLQPGQGLGLRGPFGTAWPVEAAVGKDVVIVAGGIGLAPIRPMIYHIFNNREKYGRVTLYYGARTPGDVLYEQELTEWKNGELMHVRATVDTAEKGWRGNMGVVTRLISTYDFDPNNTLAVVCGPEIMMRYGVRTLHDDGVPLNRIYVSMERNMKCAVGFCGHCQYGPLFICKDGPVFVYDDIKSLFERREL